MHFFKFFRTPRRERRILLKHQGEHANLKEIYDKINSAYFENRLNLHITWFGNKESRHRRRIILGSYNQEKKLIKIHRRLDQAHIPPHFLSFIVYHEMLHHLHPPLKARRGRRRIHHLEFAQQEKQFKEYALAKETEKLLKKEWFSS